MYRGTREVERLLREKGVDDLNTPKSGTNPKNIEKCSLKKM